MMPIPFRHLEILSDLLQALAVGGVGDLARDAAAPAGVRHQHRIAAGEREIGGERRALVAALFLDDLHQQDLPALDDFLDLVLPAVLAGTLGHIFHGVAATELLDLILFALLVVSSSSSSDSDVSGERASMGSEAAASPSLADEASIPASAASPAGASKAASAAGASAAASPSGAPAS
jgi:hypothetical protein